MTAYHQLLKANIIGVRDIIPAYTTVTVVYDITTIRNKISESSATLFVRNKIEEAIQECKQINNEPANTIEIPVCYHDSLGIDLIKIAEQKNLSIDEIIRMHTSTAYTVYMLGFLPGFAYMGTVDERIATPRLNTPRTNVKAGSVGIAGNQTGIYPLDSPGGWNIIGQTPLKMFDAKKEAPCLLKPGDIIKFVSISIEEFNRQKLHEHLHK